MYQIETSSRILQTGRKLLVRGPSRLRVSTNVLFLGLTSLFTDISSEMVTTVLPLYLLVNLNLTPMAFGVVDGVYLGAAAVVRLAGSYLADRTRRYKSVAVAGYALSVVSRIGLLAFGTLWGWLLGIVLIDRIGKGIRSDSRDALISFSTRTEIATAFGVHRALDTAGAMIGPLLAFGILMLAPRAYDAVFVVSLCAALIGLGILILFVEDRLAPATDPTPAAGITASSLIALVRRRDVLVLILASGALNLATVSDAFFYLTLQRRGQFQTGFFPLMYVVTAAIFMVLAFPMGLLADRIGRTRVFLGSYLLLLFAYALLLLPSTSVGVMGGSLLLLGGYYAGTDGVLMALASSRLPADLRASGMALLMTVINLARLAGSILFGWLWTWRGVEFAVGVFGSGLLAAIALTLLLDLGGKGTRSDSLVTS